MPDLIPRLKWKEHVDPEDFEAAKNYLSLLLDMSRANKVVRVLQRGSLTTRRANDILRATSREPLPRTDPGVARTYEKVLDGKPLSPILVVSWSHGGDIADGYHRVSTAYSVDPFVDVPLIIASVPRFKEL